MLYVLTQYAYSHGQRFTRDKQLAWASYSLAEFVRWLRSISDWQLIKITASTLHIVPVNSISKMRGPPWQTSLFFCFLRLFHQINYLPISGQVSSQLDERAPKRKERVRSHGSLAQVFSIRTNQVIVCCINKLAIIREVCQHAQKYCNFGKLRSINTLHLIKLAIQKCKWVQFSKSTQVLLANFTLNH